MVFRNLGTWFILFALVIGFLSPVAHASKATRGPYYPNRFTTTTPCSCVNFGGLPICTDEFLSYSCHCAFAGSSGYDECTPNAYPAFPCLVTWDCDENYDWQGIIACAAWSGVCLGTIEGGPLMLLCLVAANVTCVGCGMLDSCDKIPESIVETSGLCECIYYNNP